MWTPENIAALCTGIAGVIGAVTALVIQVQHLRDHAAAGAPASVSVPPDPGESATHR